MKLKYDEPLSNVAFDCNTRRYSKELGEQANHMKKEFDRNALESVNLRTTLVRRCSLRAPVLTVAS